METQPKSSVKIAIVIFVLIAIILPFCESKKAILWQQDRQQSNIFANLVFQYANLSEKIKNYVFQAPAEEKPSQADYKALYDIAKENPVFSDLIAYFQENKRQDELKNQEQLGKLNQLGQSILQALKNPIKNVAPLAESSVPVESNTAKTHYLVIGDSFMAVGGGLGDVVEKSILNYGDSAVKRYGVVSSGLSRPDYFDWGLEINKLVAEYKPDTIIAMFGANDNQSLTSAKGGLVAKYGTQAWQDGYTARVDDILEVAKENNINVFWVGLPIMRDKWFSANVASLNLIYEAECQKYQNAYFVSTWKTLANDQGNYVAYLKDQKGENELARIRDGIHLTYFGGALVTNEILDKVKDILGQI
jgi:hypothetical protein